MHTSGQLSASYVSLLIGILVVCDCVFYCFFWTCFVTEIKLSYLILSCSARPTDHPSQLA